MNLSEQQCIPCEGGVPPLEDSEKLKLKKSLNQNWVFTHNRTRLQLDLKLEKFNQPMELANKIAEVADEQWHHPELIIRFGALSVRVWTHKINDLVESDFIFAAKVDQLLRENEIAVL